MYLQKLYTWLYTVKILNLNSKGKTRSNIQPKVGSNGIEMKTFLLMLDFQKALFILINRITTENEQDFMGYLVVELLTCTASPLFLTASFIQNYSKRSFATIQKRSSSMDLFGLCSVSHSHDRSVSGETAYFGLYSTIYLLHSQRLIYIHLFVFLFATSLISQSRCLVTQVFLSFHMSVLQTFCP